MNREQYWKELEADVKAISKDGVVMLSDLTRLIERRIAARTAESACPRCGAQPGEPCVAEPYGGDIREVNYHEERRKESA